MIVIVGFFPPINLSWLRAFSIRFPGRPPMASSNEASVNERAKLTCLVLFTMRRHEREIKTCKINKRISPNLTAFEGVKISKNIAP